MSASDNISRTTEMTPAVIENKDVLEFVIFCIENSALSLGLSGRRVFELMSETDILDGYIIPCYSSLHTLSKEYLVRDLTELMQERGVFTTGDRKVTMKANQILLQMKYARIVADFAGRVGLNLREALEFFYGTLTYEDMSTGLADFHCMSDGYLCDELCIEYGRPELVESGPSVRR